MGPPQKRQLRRTRVPETARRGEGGFASTSVSVNVSACEPAKAYQRQGKAHEVVWLLVNPGKAQRGEYGSG